MWDADETITSLKSKIHQFLSNTNIAPILTPSQLLHVTRVATCIDCIMASPRVCAAVTNAVYIPFYDGIWTSDHRGLYVDLCTNSLFHGLTPTLHNPTPQATFTASSYKTYKFTTRVWETVKPTRIIKDTWEERKHGTDKIMTLSKQSKILSQKPS
jgi:hypothetical protein